MGIWKRFEQALDDWMEKRYDVNNGVKVGDRFQMRNNNPFRPAWDSEVVVEVKNGYALLRREGTEFTNSQPTRWLRTFYDPLPPEEKPSEPPTV